MCLPHDVVAVTIAIAPMFFGRVSDLRIRLNQNFLERSPKIWFTYTHKYTHTHRQNGHRIATLNYVMCTNLTVTRSHISHGALPFFGSLVISVRVNFS